MSNDSLDLDFWQKIRAQSIAQATQLGLNVHVGLPIYSYEIDKSTEVTAMRLLCVYATTMCTDGADRREAMKWLEQEGAAPYLSEMERTYLEKGEICLPSQKEELWVLLWLFQRIPHLDFHTECDRSLLRNLEGLQIGTFSKPFLSSLSPRTIEEILQMRDLGFCIHWAMRQASIEGAQLPDTVCLHTVRRRRYVLEWLVDPGEYTWDDMPLDT